MDPSSGQPPRVVFVAGWGRSGSTLLGRLLGQFEGWVDTGEFNAFFSSTWSDYYCECGTTVSDCPFWTTVLERSFDGAPAKREQLSGLYRACVRYRHIFKLQRPLDRSPEFARQVDLFGTEMARLYRSILDTSSANVLIDSSKSGLEALALAASGHVDIRVVHLVRDPRAVAFSLRRDKKQFLRQSEPNMRRYGYLRSSAEWDLRNIAAERVKSLAPYLLVSYETILNDPVGSLASIGQLAGNEQEVDFLDDKAARLSRGHAFGGNPMRSIHGKITLELDEAWRNQMPPSRRRLVQVLTYPVARSYRDA